MDTSTHHFDGSLTRFVNKIRGLGSVTRLGGGRDDLGRSGAKQRGTRGGAAAGDKRCSHHSPVTALLGTFTAGEIFPN